MENAPHSEGVRLAQEGSRENDTIDVVSLTRGMMRGDEAAYRLFHRLYFDRLFRYLVVVAGENEDSAREALQITFTRMVRHIKRFDDEKIFWSWLTVVARTAFYDQSRKRHRYFAFLERFSREPQPAEPPGEAQLQTLLSDAIATLPSDDQDLLAWKYTDGRSVRSIADELQTTDKAVESRLSRLRKKLKENLLAALKHHGEP